MPFWDECKALLALSGPLLLSNLGGQVSQLLALSLVGRALGEESFAAVALGNSLANCTGWSLVSGFSEATETLCSQAFGAGNGRKLSETLQRGVAVQLICCAPVVLLWANAGSALALLGQTPELSTRAMHYLWGLIPGVLLACASGSIVRWLAAQNETTLVLQVELAPNILSVLFQWVALVPCGAGPFGAGAAMSLAQGLRLLLLAATAARITRRAEGGAALVCWHGLDGGAALRGWGRYLALAVPAYLCVTFEWGAFEVMNMLAGVLPSPSKAITVTTVAFGVMGFLFTVFMSVGNGAAILVGNALGRGDAAGASRVVKAGVVVTASLWTALAAAFWWPGVRRAVPGVFLGGDGAAGDDDGDLDVPAAASAAVLLGVVGQLFDGVKEVLNGVIRGCGRQTWGLVSTVIAYLLVAIPVASCLAFQVGQRWLPGLRGLFTGLLLSNATHMLLNAYIVSSIDWRLEVRRAATNASCGADAAEDRPLLPRDARPAGDLDAAYGAAS